MPRDKCASLPKTSPIGEACTSQLESTPLCGHSTWGCCVAGREYSMHESSTFSSYHLYCNDIKNVCCAFWSRVESLRGRKEPQTSRVFCSGRGLPRRRAATCQSTPPPSLSGSWPRIVHCACLLKSKHRHFPLSLRQQTSLLPSSPPPPSPNPTPPQP